MNAIASVLFDAAVRGAVVLVAALGLTHLMRRRSAATRHLVWVGAIVVQLLLPLFALWDGRPQWNVAIPRAVASVMPVAIPEAPAAPSQTAALTRDISSQTLQIDVNASAPAIDAGRQPSLSNPTGIAAPSITGRGLLLGLWIVGALAIVIRLIVGTTMVAALARKGARVDDGNWLSLAQRLSNTLGIDRPLTLLRGAKLSVPVTWGIVYPVVLLPDDADNWTDERRRFVLVHEMAHVKRLDALTQLAGQFALALFWFNPLVWIANRRMQMEREHACDDYVIRHGTTPSTYAEELLSMVRSLGTSDRTSQPAFAALAMARRSEFEGRMLSILDPVLDRHPLSKGRAFTSALAALILVVPLAALHPYQRATAHAASIEVKTPVQAATQVVADDDLPESFKVSFELPSAPAGKKVATPVESLAKSTSALTKPMQALGEGMANLATAVTSVAAKAGSSTKTPGCDRFQFGSTDGASTHLHASVGNGEATIIDYTSSRADRCASATIIGAVKYSEQEDDIIAMPFGSNAAFRIRTPVDDHELVVSRAADGEIKRQFRINGENAAFDDGARRWLAAYLPTVLMEAGVNVAPRVARWRAEGGVTAALDHIRTLPSSSARRSHFDALITKGEKLTGEELDRVVRLATQVLTSSSSDLRAVLSMAAPTVKLSRQSMSALEAAVTSMASSGDKEAVLRAFGQTDDRDMLLSVMRAARTIPSSGDRARLLRVLAPRYLTKNDRDLEVAYFKLVEELPSSGDMSGALKTAVPYAAKSTAITKDVIQVARVVSSSGDRSAVLISLVSSGAVSTKDLRDQFFAAAAELPSDGDRARVLQSAASVFR